MKIKYQGIYGIFDKDGSCWYIGQSMDIYKRWRTHKGAKYKEKNWHNEMQSRLDDFTFKILELVDDVDKLRKREDYYIDLYNPKYTSKAANKFSQVGPSWNAGKTGIFDEETLEIISKKIKVVWSDTEWRKQQITKQKEVWSDPELRKRDSDKQKEVWSNPELRKRQKDKQKEVWSNPELRKRQSEIMTGKTPWNKDKTGIYSDETLKKMRAKKTGTKWMHKPNSNEKSMRVPECDIEKKKEEGYIFGRK